MAPISDGGGRWTRRTIAWKPPFFSKRGGKQSLSFRRFGRAAEAIRFAVEELPSKQLATCSLEVNGLYYFGREIRPLYDSDEYPLRRTSTKGG